jgi:WD40 repeat protein
MSAAFSPDGRRFCTAGADGAVRICDANTGRELVPALQHGGAAVRHAAFSPDGRLLVTVAGQSARLWISASGSPAGPHSELHHDGKQVLTAAFDNSGSRLVTGGEDNLARLWDVATRQQIGDTQKHDQAINFACFSPDGAQVATASDDGVARIWKIAGGESVIHDLRHRSRVNHLSFSPDGRYLATACYDNSAVVWDIATGRPFSHSLEANGDIRRVRYSPDGRYVVTVSTAGAIRMWRPVEAFRMPKPIHGAESLFSKGRSADGRLEVSSPDGFSLQVQDVGSGKIIGPGVKPGGLIFDAVFNHDGSRLLTMDNHGHGQIWDPGTGRRTPDRLLTHGSAVVCGAFSSDGRLVATGSSDDTCRVWDAATGEPLTPSMRHDGTVCQVVFSPDCNFLLTASEDGNARLWTVQTGERLSPPLDPNGWVKEVFASPDNPAVWKLEGDTRSIADLQLEAEWLSGRYIDKNLGGLVPYSREELENLRARIQLQCPQLFTLSR